MRAITGYYCLKNTNLYETTGGFRIHTSSMCVRPPLISINILSPQSGSLRARVPVDPGDVRGRVVRPEDGQWCMGRGRVSILFLFLFLLGLTSELECYQPGKTISQGVLALKLLSNRFKMLISFNGFSIFSGLHFCSTR